MRTDLSASVHIGYRSEAPKRHQREDGVLGACCVRARVKQRSGKTRVCAFHDTFTRFIEGRVRCIYEKLLGRGIEAQR